MALAETANLIVNLSLKGNFARQLGSANRALGTFDAKLDHTESRAYRAGQQIGTGIKRGATLAAVGVGVLASQVLIGLDSLVDLEKQQKQTQAAIKATGGVAGITADEVRKMAEEFESMNATIGDEVIQNTENLLLTFTSIRKKAFKPALQTILDINTRLGRGPDGLAGTARQVGKALNDPAKGLAALTRLGITFDAKTTKRIKNLQKEGKLYDAQALIIKELDKRFGGSFLAEGGTTGGKVAKFKDAIEDTQRTLASGLLPVVGNIADALSELFADPEVQKGVEDFGKNLAAVFTKDNIKAGIGTIKDILSTIGSIAGPAAAAVGKMVDAFNKLPPDLRNLLIGGFVVNKATNGLLTNIAGGIAGAIKNLVVGNMNVRAANVTVVGGGGGGVPGAPGKGGGGLGNLVKTGAGALGVAGAGSIAIAAIAPLVLSELAIQISKATGADKRQAAFKDDIIRARTAGRTPLSPETRDANKKLGEIGLQVQRKGEQTAGKLDDTKSAVDDTKTKVGTTGQAIQNTTRTSTLTGALIGASATQSTGAAIIAAIYAARPIVNVTNVTKSTTIQQRYGPGNGSQGTDNGHAGNSGPLP